MQNTQNVLDPESKALIASTAIISIKQSFELKLHVRWIPVHFLVFPKILQSSTEPELGGKICSKLNQKVICPVFLRLLFKPKRMLRSSAQSALHRKI